MSNDIGHIKDGLASIGAVHPHYAGVISNAIQCMDKQAEIVRAFGVLEGWANEGESSVVGFGPHLMSEAANRIQQLEAERDALNAENEKFWEGGDDE